MAGPGDGDDPPQALCLAGGQRPDRKHSDAGRATFRGSVCPFGRGGLSTGGRSRLAGDVMGFIGGEPSLCRRGERRLLTGGHRKWGVVRAGGGLWLAAEFWPPIGWLRVCRHPPTPHRHLVRSSLLFLFLERGVR